MSRQRRNKENEPQEGKTKLAIYPERAKGAWKN